jgi:hypothetical protein
MVKIGAVVGNASRFTLLVPTQISPRMLNAELACAGGKASLDSVNDTGWKPMLLYARKSLAPSGTTMESPLFASGRRARVDHLLRGSFHQAVRLRQAILERRQAHHSTIWRC